MWLKLTREDNNKQQLYNMDKVQCITQLENSTYLENSHNIGFHVKESLAEIELMLMDSKPSASDPRERNVIGQDTRRDNELSESDWNLRYNKP